MTERDIFLAALELTDPAARAAYVAKTCGDNPVLRAEVEELLRTHDETSQFLETPAAATNAVVDKTVIGDSSIEDDDEDGPPSSEAEFCKYLDPAIRPGWIGRLGHYEIEAILGRGAFGIVAKAFDDKLHRVVAIKLLNPALAATSPPRKRFLREARTAAAVTHENIVAIYAVEEEPIPYLVMEYIPGQTLQQRMDANGPFDIPETLKLGRQIASGLAAAHAANLIHRDIKPANILLTGGLNERAKISDFGLARAVDDASLTSSGLIAGTPMYMSPEQARGEPLDHRTDLFSLGSVLYQMASGRPPFRAANTVAVLKRVCEDRPRPLDDVIPDTPDWLQTIIFRLLEKEREDRYQSAQEVADLLERCETELRHHGRVTSVFTTPETQVLKRDPPSIANPQRKPLAWLIGGVTALVLLVGFVVMNGGKQAPEPGKTNPVTTTVMPLPMGAAAQKPSEAVGWYGWPADAPKPAIAPFNAEQAKKHQEEWAAYLKVPVEYTNSIGMKFRLIPPGEFLMGSTEEEIAEALKYVDPNVKYWQESVKSEAPQHKVILTQPIYMGMNEVTQAQYEKVMGANPSHFNANGPGKDSVAELETGDHPAEMVRWNDAAEFCAKLSNQEKLKPFYFRASETITPLDGTGYRLPSEAEWEFACHAGTATKYWIGDRYEDLVAAGWFGPNSGGRTHAAGELKANPFGLYDIHGNVWEWVQDSWDANWYSQFQEKSAINPSSPDSARSLRILRGGYWKGSTSHCRSSNRFATTPTTRLSYIGFRVSLPMNTVRQAISAPIAKNNSPTARPPVGWHGWPADAPKPALAPFDADQAKKHQEEWAAYLKVPVEYTNSLGMKFRLIPPGEFLMGSTPEEIETAFPIAGDDQTWQDCIRSEGPLHKVILTQPFFLATNEVTQAQFQRILETNPSRFSASGEWADSVTGLETSSFPVESVDWASARDFCQQLARREGLAPDTSAANGARTPFGAEPYRLPAEAEWEFACRAGSTSQFFTGKTPADLSKVGWFNDNSSERTHATGELVANAFGLHDMHGNVWEWVLDAWQSDRYAARAGKPAVDPYDPMTKESEPLTRGGNWSSYAEACRSASRCSASSAYNSSLIGFRVAMSVAAVQDQIAKQRLDLTKPAITPSRSEPAADREAVLAEYYAVNRRAAEKALSVGGSVLLERLPSHELSGLRTGDALPDGPFLVRQWSVFNSSTVTNADVQVLRGLRHIREIGASAAFNRLDAGAIPHIAAVRAPLQFLSFHHPIKTSDLAALPTLEQLTMLWVLGHDVDDDWACLDKFPHLRSLNVNQGPIPSLASLSKFPQLRSLALTVNEEPDLAVLPELQRLNPRLRAIVQVGTNHRVVGHDPLRAAVPELIAAGLPLLAVRFDGTSNALNQENVETTFDEGVMSVKLEAIPSSVRLSDSARGQLTLLGLQQLDAVGHREADLLAAVLANRHDMHTLYLRDSDLTDSGLKKLESLIGLQYLDISGTNVTEEGVKAFRAAVPGCILHTSTGTLEPDYAADPAYPGRRQNVSQSSGWHGWPTDAPPPAIAPFDADQAKKHQEEWAAYLKVPVEYTNSIGMKFRLIPPGEFLMGGTPEEIAAALEADLAPFNGDFNWWSACLRSEGPRHRVRLTRPFYLGTHEVTQQQYQEIIGENPSENSPTGSNRERVAGLETANFPVEFLSWHDAVQFCNRLNEREQRTNRHLTTMPPMLSDTGTGYRLPTEAEWEFACRAGTTARYWTGHDVDSVLKAGWFQVNDGGRTHAVGELLANPFGLFDVHGNAWEWTADGWDESWYQQFADKLAVDPVCPLTDQPVAMMKAGTWPAFEHFCRAASRIPWPCDARNSLQGMRVTLSVEAVRESLKGAVSSTPDAGNLNSYFARNRRAAEKVLAVGGEQAHVVMEIQNPYEWRTLRPGEPLPDLPFVVREWSIKGSATAASDDLEVLAGLQHVLSLNLATSAPLDAQCIPNIAALSSSLKELVVANNNIRTSDLGKLPPMPCADVLWVLGEQVDDDWKFLKRFPALRYLEVYGASFPALGPLGDSPNLHCVRISGGGTAPDAAQVADAQKRNPHLRLLFEADGKFVLLGSDPAIQSVQRLVKAGIPVEALSGDGTVKALSATTIEEIQSILAIRYIVKSIPHGVVLDNELRQCLADVDLSNVKAEGLADADSFVQCLVQRQDTEHLDLTDSDLTDDGLRLLSQHAGLRSLAVKGTRVTADGTAAFHRAVPGCHIYADTGDLPPEILPQAAREPKESQPDASPTR